MIYRLFGFHDQLLNFISKLLSVTHLTLVLQQNTAIVKIRSSNILSIIFIFPCNLGLELDSLDGKETIKPKCYTQETFLLLTDCAQ